MRPQGQVQALAVLCAMWLSAGVARATTYVVSTNADSGAGSLREALVSANTNTLVAHTIQFTIGSPGSPATITLTSTLPSIVAHVTIDGTTSPAGRVVVTGSGVANGFPIALGPVTIRGLVINGFTAAQIRITGGTGHVIEGNYIGPNAAGTASASPSSSTGIWITNSGGSRIGGYTAAERNVISGNGTGIFFDGTYATPNTVVGNYIGTTATGLAALKNNGAGIDDFLGSPNTIGGTAAGAGNVISGNGSDGISVGISGSTGYVVQGNLIGVGADDVTPVGNGRHGVRFLSSMNNSLIGGPAPNHIAYNASAGVLIALTGDSGNAIRGNSIHDNGALGIDINGSGVNANDPGDGDTGSNDGQNFPVLDAFFAGGDQIDVTLDSTPNTTFTIELFANADCDGLGYGEAEELVGSYVVATDATGHVAFSATMTRAIDPSEWVTATATDPAGSTSELSRCAPSPFPTTTTSTSTTSSTSTSTSSSSTSSSTVTTSSTTTSTSSTSSTVETTSSTSTTAEPTTSSTSTTETTSSTLAVPSTTTTSTAPEGVSTTSTSTLEDATTTSSSTLPGATTSSTSTLPGATTTSSSSTSSSTVEEATTTSTSTLPEETTTSTSSSTLADPTTTSTTSSSLVEATTTSSTSTLAEATTSSSSTLPGDTTSSTSTVPLDTTTSTSSSTLPEETTTTSTTLDDGSTTTSSSSSTTTTVHPGSTTSTTQPPRGCGNVVAFAPLRCRLDDLTTTIHDEADLAPMRPKLDKHLLKARRMLDKAEARCQIAKTGPAKKNLRLVRKRLKMVGKALAGKPVRRAVPSDVTAPIARIAATLGTDVRAFATSIVCR